MQLRTIHKYLLKITDQQDIEMPHLAQILCVQMQDGHLYIWAMVDDEAPMDSRTIRIIGTGNPIDDGNWLNYIGAVQEFDGELIWHVFERMLTS